VLVHFDDDDVERQLTVFTALWWTFVNDIESVPVSPTRTRVTTTYAIGARRPWTLATPLIGYLLRRNNAELMIDDIPMRERRGLLRAWGYTFRGDGERRSIVDSLPIHRDNVVAPAAPEGLPSGPIPVSQISETAWTFVGRSDHLGLKLRREGRTIQAFPRMCPHEGADLDDAPVEDGCLTCPWHGRRLAPVAILDMDAPSPEAETSWHRLRVDGDRLHIAVGTLAPVEGSVDRGR
ncbi:MAG TPA: Rieske (2Fe-2S) protein, partial [Acidimicrobiales bacterium]|nr:Rieske (2Fe-2S) protein [Acidimicrobiales bacterium]